MPCPKESHNIPLHTNGYLDVNGVPYLLGEYLDKQAFQQFDTAFVDNSITVDTREALRAVINVNINTIGINASTGRVASIGNKIKYKKLISEIAKYRDKMDHHLSVIKGGLILRVHYQLENRKNGIIISTMSEDFRVNDRSYFVDINPNNIDDNAVICIFNDFLVSTVNEFTHGRERMQIRITGIDLFYECVKNARRGDYSNADLSNGHYAVGPWGDRNMYYYHEAMQKRAFIGDDVEQSLDVRNPGWDMFNRFYHFEDRARSIILHKDEINDPVYAVALIPCYKVKTNKLFVVNPGHRLIFRFNVAMNDVIVVGDSSEVAEVIRAPYYDHHHCPEHHEEHYHPHDKEFGHLIDMLYRERHDNDVRSQIIDNLSAQVEDLRKQVEELSHKEDTSFVPDIEDPNIQVEPPGEIEPPEIVNPSEGGNTVVPEIEPDEGNDLEVIPPIVPPTITEGPSI